MQQINARFERMFGLLKNDQYLEICFGIHTLDCLAKNIQDFNKNEKLPIQGLSKKIDERINNLSKEIIRLEKGETEQDASEKILREVTDELKILETNTDLKTILTTNEDREYYNSKIGELSNQLFNLYNTVKDYPTQDYQQDDEVTTLCNQLNSAKDSIQIDNDTECAARKKLFESMAPVMKDLDDKATKLYSNITKENEPATQTAQDIYSNIRKDGVMGTFFFFNHPDEEKYKATTTDAFRKNLKSLNKAEGLGLKDEQIEYYALHAMVKLMKSYENHEGIKENAKISNQENQAILVLEKELQDQKAKVEKSNLQVGDKVSDNPILALLLRKNLTSIRNTDENSINLWVENEIENLNFDNSAQEKLKRAELYQYKISPFDRRTRKELQEADEIVAGKLKL